MSTLRAQNQSISQKENALILQNSFNIIFKKFVEFKGANNKQYFFQTYDQYQQIELLGYQQFVLSGQLKMLKKYNLEGDEIKILNKSNEFFIKGPGAIINLYKFDSCHNLGQCEALFTESDYEDHFSLYKYFGGKIIEIGINYNEDMFVFQNFKEIFFYNRGEDGKWSVDQTIQCEEFYEMRQIKFNESNNKIIVQQTHANQDGYFFLNIFQKNRSNDWSITHNILQIDEIFFFCFINDQQFVCFKQNEHIKQVMQIIYEISEEVYEEYGQFQETFQFERSYEENGNLFEIKSKKLIVLYGSECLFCFSKQSGILKLLTKLPLKNILYINQVEDQDSQFLFFNINNVNHNNSNQYKCKIQVHRIYVE